MAFLERTLLELYIKLRQCFMLVLDQEVMSLYSDIIPGGSTAQEVLLLPSIIIVLLALQTA